MVAIPDKNRENCGTVYLKKLSFDVKAEKNGIILDKSF